MSETNTEVVRTKGRQPGQRVQSLDYRAYKALRDFPFPTVINDDNKDDVIESLIERLRERDIF